MCRQKIVGVGVGGGGMLLNKKPKGPHIVHLSTMCHRFERSARDSSFEILLPVRFS